MCFIMYYFNYVLPFTKLKKKGHLFVLWDLFSLAHWKLTHSSIKREGLQI